MSVIVTDSGFGADDWSGEFAGPDNWQPGAGLELGPETNPEDATALLGRAELIRVLFPSFADGRGFTIARRLRLLGFVGRLRAAGHLIADQYAMARRAGFDEVEIPDELAARQPQDQWLRRADWRSNDYQSRLRA